MEFLVQMIILSLFLLFILCYYNKKSPKTRDPPGPPRLPFIGNLHQIDVSCLHESLRKLSRKYGPLMLIKFGSIPTLVVSSAKLAEEVMKNQDLIFCSRPKLCGQQKLSYNGLDIALAPYNQEWREMRKISVLHLLSMKRLHQFRPIREDDTSRMIQKIRNEAQSGLATNLSETLISTAMTNICRIAFGKRLLVDDHQRKRMESILRDSQEMFMGFFFSDYFPCLGWMDYLTGMHSRLEKTFQMADSFYQELIDEHLDPNRPSSMDNDIIDIMLQLQRDGSIFFDITMDRIKAMLMNVFLAGTETTATTLIWAMTALMKNPLVMKKLQAEIRQVAGGKEFVDEDDIDKLPYLAATIKETMRLYPTVPLLLPRLTMERCKLDGYDIEAKTMVHVNVWTVGRDPELWENVDEFCPERFLNNRQIDLKGQDFELTPFGSGRRSCPGLGMGLQMVNLLLANLLHSFDWDFPKGMTKEDLDTVTVPGFSLFKKNALKIIAKIPYHASV